MHRATLYGQSGIGADRVHFHAKAPASVGIRKIAQFRRADEGKVRWVEEEDRPMTLVSAVVRGMKSSL